MLQYAILITLAIIATVTAADDIEDLGVITDTNGILLEACKERRDFSHFIVEFLPAEYPTNKVTIVTVTNVLTLENLVQVPHGHAIMGVRSVCKDRAESPLRLYRVDIRRDPPSAPSAHTFHVMKNLGHQSIESLVQSHRARTNALPPTPGQTNGLSSILPLPNGAPKTYSQHIDEMRRYYATRAKDGQEKARK